ncbi:MAG: hypothetical protein EBR51_10690 [Gammaproteobacteria bacterium]|nr:hypothetical protein [Gammaproteobacteria bacterium]
MKLAVLGAGAWGTAISISLATRHAVRLWVRDPAAAAGMRASRVNARYLPDIPIPAEIEITAQFNDAVAACDLVLVATTTAGLRTALRQIAAGDLA